jgi:leader peptidase (prepilin peptidase)/N-methyltransferase
MLVELLAAALSLLVWWQFVARAPELAPGIRSARYALGFGFAGVLLVLSFIDLDTKRLPDSITLPSIAVFFLAGFGAQMVPWHERAIGAAAGYLAVRIIADGYYYLTGREGLGLGDGKLLAVVGATLGWRSLPVVVFGASLLGIAVAVPALLLARRRASAAVGPDVPPVRRTEVPFGPFLSLSALIYLFVGDVIWRAVAVLTGAE